MPLDAKALADVTAEIVTRHVAQATAPLLKRIEQLEARPIPVDGKDGTNGTDGRDGVGLAGALIDRSGVLVLTLSDGTTRDLGVVVGKDGSDGKDGNDGLPGEAGKDGQDGFGLDDFDVEAVDERTIKLKFVRGEVAHSYELEFPVMLDKGVYKEGEAYVRGDAVTWGGSLWIAQTETKAKPDGPESGWRLAVKKGRDGKDAK